MTAAQYRAAVAACREQYGDAHDAHMDLNDECPWCGLPKDPALVVTNDAGSVPVGLILSLMSFVALLLILGPIVAEISAQLTLLDSALTP